MMSTVQRMQKCPMCGGSNMTQTEATYKNGFKESVPTCQACGHMSFAGETYGYVINGIAHKWSSPADLKGTIEAILRATLPADNVKDLSVEVVEYA